MSSKTNLEIAQAVKLIALNEFQLALEILDKAKKSHPKDALVLYNYSLCLIKLEKFQDAIAPLKKVLQQHPSLIQALSNLAVALNASKRHQESLIYFRKALEIDAVNIELLNNYGSALIDSGHIAEAFGVFDTAFQLNPNVAQALVNKGAAHTYLRQSTLAIACYEKALEIEPENQLAADYLGQLYLGEMNFKYGWPLYEKRGSRNKYAMNDGSHPLKYLPNKLWDGQQKFERLLVWSEQGVGDQILYGSILREFADWKEGQVIVALDRRLVPSFQRSFINIEFIDKDSYSNINYDYHIPMPILGRLFIKDKNWFLNSSAFLLDDQNKTRMISDATSQMTGGEKYLCGVSWRSKNINIGADKTIMLQDLRSIFESEQCDFIDLQYGDTSAERRKLKSKSKLYKVDSVDNFEDIDELISLIQVCKYIVTTSNTTAHLAGALGKKTFLLVPYSKGKLWYWHSINGQSLWYPNTEVFEQCPNEGWVKPIKMVKERMSQLR